MKVHSATGGEIYSMCVCVDIYDRRKEGSSFEDTKYSE